MMPSTNISALGRSLSDYSIENDGKVDSMKSRLKPGQLIRGKVIDKLPGGRFVFRLNGLNMVAQSVMKLSPGMIVYAHVAQLKPKLVLKFAEGKNAKNRLKNGLKSLGIRSNPINDLIADSMMSSGIDFTSEVYGEIIHQLESKIDEDTTLEEISEELKSILHNSVPVTHKPNFTNTSVPELVSGITRDIQVLVSQFALSGIRMDKQWKYIESFVAEWRHTFNSKEVKAIGDIISVVGLNHESRVASLIQKGKVPVANDNISLKGSVIAIRDQILDLLTKGYKSFSLNKLLLTTDNILGQMDSLRMRETDGYVPLSFYKEQNDNSGFFISRKTEKETEEDWCLKIETNLEPSGNSLVFIETREGKLNLNFMLQEKNKEIAIDMLDQFKKRLAESGYGINTIRLV